MVWFVVGLCSLRTKEKEMRGRVTKRQKVGLTLNEEILG